MCFHSLSNILPCTINWNAILLFMSVGIMCAVMRSQCYKHEFQWWGFVWLVGLFFCCLFCLFFFHGCCLVFTSCFILYPWIKLKFVLLEFQKHGSNIQYQRHDAKSQEIEVPFPALPLICCCVILERHSEREDRVVLTPSKNRTLGHHSFYLKLDVWIPLISHRDKRVV